MSQFLLSQHFCHCSQGDEYGSYKGAAIARGLLEDDTEWKHCLQEASLFMMPTQLRELFASILHENAPAKPGDLWDDFKGGPVRGHPASPAAGAWS